MKKNLFVSAMIMASLSLPALAKETVGKVTGISLTGDKVTVTIEQGTINPFANEKFTPSGTTVTETVPVDIGVEPYIPQRGERQTAAPQKKEQGARQGSTREGNTSERREPNGNNPTDNRKPPMQRASVKQLSLDQLVCLVYADDNTTVEKILVQPNPMMQVEQRQPAQQEESGQRKKQQPQQGSTKRR